MQVRFRIRDLLWLAAVVALAAAWWIDHRRVVRDAAIKDDLAQVKIKMLEGMLQTLDSRPSPPWPPLKQEPDPPKSRMPIMRPPQKSQAMPNAVEDAVQPR